MSGPSEMVIEAAWDGAQGSPLRAERSLTAERVYPIIEREVVAAVVKGEYPVAYETIRADVIREVAEALRRRYEAGDFEQPDPPYQGSLDFIEREFGGES